SRQTKYKASSLKYKYFSLLLKWIGWDNATFFLIPRNFFGFILSSRKKNLAEKNFWRLERKFGLEVKGSSILIISSEKFILIYEINYREWCCVKNKIIINRKQIEKNFVNQCRELSPIFDKEEPNSTPSSFKSLNSNETFNNSKLSMPGSSKSISKTPKRKQNSLIEDSQHQSKSPLKLGTSPKPDTANTFNRAFISNPYTTSHELNTSYNVKQVNNSTKSISTLSASPISTSMKNLRLNKSNGQRKEKCRC
ncbi:hypothetical protein BpHYR1_014068, partial [Brachionus plicatilis]